MKASAGSGKTWNLAGKYISLLLKSDDRYAYRHILAVTFTNKATDEMKSRILKELHLLATEPEVSGYVGNFIPSVFRSLDELRSKAESVLHDILHDYSSFAISTIDRFFQQTLKAFSREIGQFASYQVELDKDSLVAESVDRILDSLTEEDDSLLAWLTADVLEQIEQGGRYSLDANLMEMAKRLKSAQRQEVLEASGVDEDTVCSKDHLEKVRSICRSIMHDFRVQVRERARAVLDILEQAGVSPSESSYHFMEQLYVYAELAEGGTVMPPTDTFMKRAPDHELWFPRAKSAVLLPAVYPFLEAPLSDFLDLWGDAYAVFNTAYILDSQLYGLGVAGELSKTFKELMKEKNVLCIDDSNTILRDIIDGSDAPFVYEKLGVRFEHFLLDEFQDTSKVQWLNFSPLLHNSDSQGGENLIVGDVKQSIYRWRGSDWQLLEHQIPAEFPDSVQNVLDTNWRSLSNIIGFNNGFFQAAASQLDLIGGYAENGPLSRIYADVRQKVASGDKPSGSVSLTFCDKEMQLQKVLESVYEAVAAGLNLSEIAVLVRSNSIGEEVAAYLMDNGVTVITDDSLKVKGALTVRRMVSLMSYVDNPGDTVSGYLAESLDIPVPEACNSLVDMAEAILRSLMKSDADDLWRSEILHVQSFMDHLQDYVSMNGNSLRGFLKWWEDEDPSISSPSSGNSVRIMTIHKSKGLDFPYVIVPFADSVTLFKPENRWCVPDFAGTALEGAADGVYDVSLSSVSESTLFAEDFLNEKFLQHVDNLNVMYVALTRAAWGLHVIAKTPSASFVKALDKNSDLVFRDVSQIIYWYVSKGCAENSFVRTTGDGYVRYDSGVMGGYETLRKSADKTYATFDVPVGGEYPSFALNPPSDGENQMSHERGRLRYSPDTADFFNGISEGGMSSSNRVKGVVLHDVLSRINVISDLEDAVERSVSSGDISADEREGVLELLRLRLEEVKNRGWFSEDAGQVYNERDMIDTDGQIYRPDRVVVSEGKVVIVDYKFGEHRASYLNQIRKYADIWQRMGYADVSACLWYVQTGEIVEM